ncbi:MAG: hypothetical protein Fur0020_07360 [Thermodesulfovibrionia bacterium]
MAILLTFLIFLMLLLIPFIPALLELLKPTDASPLFIRMDYSKDARYFGNSFRNILKNAIITDMDIGMREVKLSKDEIVEIAQSKRIGKGERYEHILYILGSLITEEKARFDKEIYVKGDAVIGCENVLRAIACDGRLSISSGVTIIRWVDAEGGIEISDNCNLGISLSSSNGVKIGKDCRFKRLYGMPIMTYKDIERGYKVGLDNTQCPIDEDHLIISPFTKIEKDLIVRKGLLIKKGCVLVGSIKTYGNLIIEGDTTVFGNIFSEADIEIGERTTVRGDVFSQGSVTVRQGVKIGDVGKVKSVIGKRRIMINDDVTIYGYVMTEGVGMVV